MNFFMLTLRIWVKLCHQQSGVNIYYRYDKLFVTGQLQNGPTEDLRISSALQ